MTVTLTWPEEDRTEDSWRKLDQEWKSVRWEHIYLSYIRRHFVPEEEWQLCNSSSKKSPRKKGKGRGISRYVMCMQGASCTWKYFAVVMSEAFKSTAPLRQKLSRHSQPPTCRSFVWKSHGGKKIEAGVLQNTVLNPTTYGVFQDQPGFQRKRKKQYSERAAKRSLSLWRCKNTKRSCGPSSQQYPENPRSFHWGDTFDEGDEVKYFRCLGVLENL